MATYSAGYGTFSAVLSIALKRIVFQMRAFDGKRQSHGYERRPTCRSGSRGVRSHPSSSLYHKLLLMRTVCTADDVQLAIKHGVDGVVISNHGGRQLDGQPATLDALRECAPVARGRIPIALDGGIRSGADIFKAIALGASMCFVGRVPIWGLAVFSLSSPCIVVNVANGRSITGRQVLIWRLRSILRNSAIR